MESEPFSRAFYELANPLPADRLAGLLRGMFRPGIHSLSLTGGEPLEQAEGLEALLEALAPAPAPLYLETNGTLPGAFERVADAVDVVAMDVKLDSVTGQESRLGDHCAFLAAARPGQAFLKLVVCEGVDLDELEEAALELGALGRARSLVLQPATAEGVGVAAALPGHPAGSLRRGEPVLRGRAGHPPGPPRRRPPLIRGRPLYLLGIEE